MTWTILGILLFNVLGIIFAYTAGYLQAANDVQRKKSLASLVATLFAFFCLALSSVLATQLGQNF